MATRYLTELFSLMRNSSQYNKNIYKQRNNSDKQKLLSRTKDSDDEMEMQDEILLPPAWNDHLEQAQYIISLIKTKLTELEELHKKCLRTSVLSDEKSKEEILMENLGNEISRHIMSAHKAIMTIKSYLYSSNNSLEKKLIDNIVRSFTVTLQAITCTFRNEQNSFLKQINSMEEYTNEFFDSINDFNAPSTSSFQIENLNTESKTSVETFDNFLKPANNYSASQLDDLNNDERLDEYFQIRPNDKLNQRQLLQFEVDNTKMAEEREKQVINVVKSIMDLNSIYKDLSNMVQEQGTILDRIDYNIECTQTKVFEGYKQLQKADRYQRANRKIYCIMILAGVTLFMLVLLIITKF